MQQVAAHELAQPPRVVGGEFAGGDQSLARGIERAVERLERRLTRLGEELLELARETVEEIFLALPLAAGDLADAFERRRPKRPFARSGALAAEVGADRAARTLALRPAVVSRWR